ncbi:FAD-dependent oxidoreductase, partial [Cellulosimicrobium funkei]|uniref:FAD-dependent oxidoreductase n=1 Tax=Cellulosimicrobium funkei TaxID=264251 RepID=UPI00375716DB
MRRVDLDADLVVLACGTVPEAGLARAAGLTVDRGVVVGPDLASPDDPRVFAIGDCAQPPEGGTGLIAQGWDQARRLAQDLAERLAAGGSVSCVYVTGGQAVRATSDPSSQHAAPSSTSAAGATPPSRGQTPAASAATSCATTAGSTPSHPAQASQAHPNGCSSGSPAAGRRMRNVQRDRSS